MTNYHNLQEAYGRRRAFPQRHHGARRVGPPKVASDQAASRFGVPPRPPPFSSPRCGSRRQSCRATCHACRRGRRQPVRRGAAFARGYTPQTAHPPSCRLPPRRARTTTMYATAPVKRGGPRSRIRAPTRHERASPPPARKCRSRGRKPLTRREDRRR